MQAEGDKQINQMVSFIMHEAKQKAEEIERKSKEEFNINRMQIVKDSREKVRKEYATKIKKAETAKAIGRSTAINQARLAKAKERSDCLDNMVENAREKLQAVTQDKGKYKKLLEKLIVQGCLKLLENHVVVQCRAQDTKLVTEVLSAAEALYASTVEKQTGVKQSVSLTVNAKPTEIKDCSGGVLLSCHNGLIVVDNTMDARLRLVEEQDKPHIRKLVFPVN